MSFSNIETHLREICKNVLINEPMKKHTSFKTGGNCDFMVLPNSEEELIKVLKFCIANKVNYFVMGNGSNLLVSDKGVDGVIIKLGKKLEEYEIKGNQITAQSGILLSKLANIALKNSLTGLEFASGIPGTLGGAIVMNAGAYGGEMKDVIIKTKYIDDYGNIIEIEKSEHDFSYRHSMFSNKNYVILSSSVKLSIGDPSEIECSMSVLNAKRREKQPLDYPSAGSAFKRPEGGFAAKLIDEAGLKGFTIGGAQVSCKHTGFIINIGDATTNDILNVMDYVKNEIIKKFNITLEPEVKFIGIK